jgi:hypothetical protein
MAMAGVLDLEVELELAGTCSIVMFDVGAPHKRRATRTCLPVPGLPHMRLPS